MKSIINTRIILLLIFNVILSHIAYASSVYHLKGVGIIMTTHNADAFGRGGTEIGLVNRTTINTNNPANLIVIDISRFSATYLSEQVSAKTEQLSGRYNYYNIHNVRLAIPIIINRLVFTMGVQPFSRNNFKSVTEGLLTIGSEYSREIHNKGGISQFQIGFAALH